MHNPFTADGAQMTGSGQPPETQLDAAEMKDAMDELQAMPYDDDFSMLDYEEVNKDFDNLDDRLKKIEEEAQRIREMQSEVEKQFHSSSASAATGSPAGQLPPMLSLEEKMLIDSRSVHVGNVDYSATPDQLEEHFRGCGTIERVTILTDKFSGHPKGFAYIQFTDAEGMKNAQAMSDSLFIGRQIKVTAKRTNRPGISSTNRPPRGRGRARMIIKYVYPTRGMRRPRRRGFSPY